ncbi:flagellar export chaperone FliS [Candidatus Latescibacterota bacterium]
MKASSQQKGFKAYQEAQANQLEQSKLVLMMFSGGIKFLDKALVLAETDKVQMSENISKAKNVLLEIISSLNIEDSGEIGTTLLNAYKRLFQKLNTANMNDDTKKISEVRNSLAELEEVWKKIFSSDEYEQFKLSRIKKL